MEYLRKDLKSVITQKDDGDLFQIVNNFGIRHYNDKQKTNYDRAVWLSWMFHFLLCHPTRGAAAIGEAQRKDEELTASRILNEGSQIWSMIPNASAPVCCGTRSTMAPPIVNRR